MSRSRLLLIDDEADIREVAALALETIGDYEVLTAANGLEGIERAVAAQPDAILLDVMMPGLDGPSTLERLKARQETRNIPVVFLTAKVRPSDRQYLTALGVRGIIAKPFNPLTLAEEVAELLAGNEIHESDLRR